ncbi:hypothetical protein GWC77_19815 [Paraburkholderia sp. NMBU_R16]|uniref:hypothetical protein n=1 Tax=Paraburkholderia sp. NMBU_R16 TaxID=2698676 RepID=UPI0015664521|nr:hypothetical protein [Paraburkholderia sp. NMBU_R16]NRO98177.1 hypothetical protein [Paraburkholderia sp. NMBU_R16]
MDDTQYPASFSPLTIEQTRELAAAIREVFGGNLSRESFADKLLMFLEDVPGYEFCENAVALTTSAWAEYTDRDP